MVPGRVCSAVRNGRLTFCYEDGDREDITCNAIRQCRCTGTVTCKYAVNQRVEGNWEGYGDWYSGRVTARTSACAYTVRYDDGDTETGVSERNVRPASRCVFRNGMTNIEANWRGGGTWYRGRICGAGNKACTWNICFADGDRENNVPDGRIREERRN